VRGVNERVHVHVRNGVMSAPVQTAVLLMKMHSYIVVNRHLKLEVSESGDCAPACKRNAPHPQDGGVWRSWTRAGRARAPSSSTSSTTSSGGGSAW